MSGWLAPACAVLDGGLGDAVTLACLVLGVLLVGAIAAGFAALRVAVRPRSCRLAPTGDGGLVDLWRLARQPGRATPGGRPLVRAAPTSADRTSAARPLAADR